MSDTQPPDPQQQQPPAYPPPQQPHQAAQPVPQPHQSPQEAPPPQQGFAPPAQHQQGAPGQTVAPGQGEFGHFTTPPPGPGVLGGHTAPPQRPMPPGQPMPGSPVGSSPAGLLQWGRSNSALFLLIGFAVLIVLAVLRVVATDDFGFAVVSASAAASAGLWGGMLTLLAAAVLSHPSGSGNLNPTLVVAAGAGVVLLGLYALVQGLISDDLLVSPFLGDDSAIVQFVGFLMVAALGLGTIAAVLLPSRGPWIAGELVVFAFIAASAAGLLEGPAALVSGADTDGFAELVIVFFLGASRVAPVLVLLAGVVVVLVGRGSMLVRLLVVSAAAVIVGAVAISSIVALASDVSFLGVGGTASTAVALASIGALLAWWQPGPAPTPAGLGAPAMPGARPAPQHQQSPPSGPGGPPQPNITAAPQPPPNPGQWQ